jgi:hypothetical protein
MHVSVAGRAARRSRGIAEPQCSHTPYVPSVIRCCARASSSRYARPWPSSVETLARSKASVDPSGSCSSSALAAAVPVTMSSNSAVSASIRAIVASLSVRRRSCALSSLIPSYSATRSSRRDHAVPSQQRRQRSVSARVRAKACGPIVYDRTKRCHRQDASMSNGPDVELWRSWAKGSVRRDVPPSKDS